MEQLLQYGALGIIVIMFAAVIKILYKDSKEESKKLSNEHREERETWVASFEKMILRQEKIAERQEDTTKKIVEKQNETLEKITDKFNRRIEEFDKTIDNNTDIIKSFERLFEKHISK